MKANFSSEFLEWYEQVRLSKITILDLWFAWCAGRSSLYKEVEQFNAQDNFQTHKIQ